GPEEGDVLLIGWGGTHGALKAATLALQEQGVRVSCCQLRYLNPLPKQLPALMRKFKHVIVAELNLGQLRMILRAATLVDAQGLNKVRGQPFTIGEVMRSVRSVLAGGPANCL